MSAAKAKKQNKRGYFFYDFVKVTAGLPGLLWFRPKVWYENDRARERINGGALLIANHSGMLDPISMQLAVWYRRHHFICLKVFFEKPVSAWLFKRFHCIPVDRENFGMETLREIVAVLREDKLVSMFPEGRMVGDTAHTETFKSGMVLMAAMSRKPIIPMYIAPRKHFYSRLHVVIGEPEDIVPASGPLPSLVEIEKITAYLHDHEERLRAIYQEKRRK